MKMMKTMKKKGKSDALRPWSSFDGQLKEYRIQISAKLLKSDRKKAGKPLDFTAEKLYD